MLIFVALKVNFTILALMVSWVLLAVQGKISPVKVWHLRSTRMWKDGEWIELPSSGQDHSSQVPLWLSC